MQTDCREARKRTQEGLRKTSIQDGERRTHAAGPASKVGDGACGHRAESREGASAVSKDQDEGQELARWGHWRPWPGMGESAGAEPEGVVPEGRGAAGFPEKAVSKVRRVQRGRGEGRDQEGPELGWMRRGQAPKPARLKWLGERDLE